MPDLSMRYQMSALALHTVLGFSLAYAATAQVLVPLQHLVPDSLHGGSAFGSTVGISDGHVFVLNGQDPSILPGGGGVIDVFEVRQGAWVRIQQLYPDAELAQPFAYNRFLVAGDVLAAPVADRVHIYERFDGMWERVQELRYSLPNIGHVLALGENVLVVAGHLTDPQSTGGSVVFERIDGEWMETGLLQSRQSTCLAGRTIAQHHDDDTILFYERRNANWTVVDSVQVSVQPGIARLSCETNTIAVPDGKTVHLLNRREDGRWNVAESMHRKHYDWLTSLLLNGDQLYLSYENWEKLPDNPFEGVYVSDIVVFSRRFGMWEHVRNLPTLRPIDATWEPHDGGFGQTLAADSTYLVSGAPFRFVQVDDELRYEVGEVFVLATGYLDNRGEPAPEIPHHELAWSSIHPNPTRGETTIVYELPQEARVNAEIFDLLGRRVQTLVNGMQSAGDRAMIFDTSDWAPGLYFVRMTVNNRGTTSQSFVVR